MPNDLKSKLIILDKLKFATLYLSLALFFANCNENKTIKTGAGQIDKTSKTNAPKVEDKNIENIDCDNCPFQGNAKTLKLKELNILKNRINFPSPKDINALVTLNALLKKGDDTDRWNTRYGARITGYVYDVKPGGVETSNCKSKEKDLRDTHIELILNPMSNEKNEIIIVEVTPRMRKIMAANGEDWRTSTLRTKYLGRLVEIEGWMLFDFEHKNMAENTHPNNPKNWRGSAWEIHPITKIKIAEKH